MAREEVVPSGYDEEERYFHEQDVELIKKKRDELDAARQQQEREARKLAHWMKCPKCGADLQEIEMDQVRVDKCPDCQGIFFDKGELELVIEGHKGGFLPRLRKLLRS